MIRDKKGRIIDSKTGDPIQQKRQLSDAALRIIEKHGGNSFGGRVNITDSETGKSVYNNDDAYQMAKQYIKLGGEAYYSDLKKALGDKAAEREYFLNELCLNVKCTECNQDTKMPYTSAYMVYYRRLETDQAFDKDLDVRSFWFCSSCGKKQDILNMPENEEEKQVILNKIEEIFKSDADEDKLKYRFK